MKALTCVHGFFRILVTISISKTYEKRHNIAHCFIKRNIILSFNIAVKIFKLSNEVSSILNVVL